MGIAAGYRTPAACLALLLSVLLPLATGPGALAHFVKAGAWPAWNKASTPRFPGKTWLKYATPEEAGWSSERLARAEKIARKSGSAAVMVIHDGAVLAQWGQTERRFMAHSIRKSLLSALYGIAVSAGDINLQETIGSIGIDDIDGLTPVEKSAMISDLLKSRSGVYLPAAYETRSARASRPPRGSYRPGSHWYYNNWDFNALATIYQKKTASDVFQAFRARIAQPLQMQDFALRHTLYHLEPESSRHPAYRFRLSARDLARFGLLFLNEGRWNGRQIVPADWVRESTRAWSKTGGGGGYAYMWWTENGQLGELGAYAAWGYGGHAVYVVPGARLVFVHRADTYADRHVRNGAVVDILKAVLKARTGPPRAAPRLVALPPSPPGKPRARPERGGLNGMALFAPATTASLSAIQTASQTVAAPDILLSEARLAALTGRYRHGDMIATVSVVDGWLEFESPRRGRFRLIPGEGAEFLMEDAEVPVAFTPGRDGRAAALRVWFEAEETLLLQRVE